MRDSESCRKGANPFQAVAVGVKVDTTDFESVGEGAIPSRLVYMALSSS